MTEYRAVHPQRPVHHPRLHIVPVVQGRPGERTLCGCSTASQVAGELAEATCYPCWARWRSAVVLDAVREHGEITLAELRALSEANAWRFDPVAAIRSLTSRDLVQKVAPFLWRPAPETTEPETERQLP